MDIFIEANVAQKLRLSVSNFRAHFFEMFSHHCKLELDCFIVVMHKLESLASMWANLF